MLRDRVCPTYSAPSILVKISVKKKKDRGSSTKVQYNAIYMTCSANMPEAMGNLQYTPWVKILHHISFVA